MNSTHCHRFTASALGSLIGRDAAAHDKSTRPSAVANSLVTNPFFRRIPFRILLIALCALRLTAAVSAEPVRFAREFAPLPGCVSTPEKPLRQEECLNGLWQFQPVAVPGDWVTGTGTPPELPPPDPAKWEAVQIKIPSPWNTNGVLKDEGFENGGDFQFFPSYPKSWDTVKMGWMQREFAVPAGWKKCRIVLRFEAVSGDCQVWLNGKKLYEQFDNFLPFEVDVTEAVKSSGSNALLVGVRAPALHNTQGKLGMVPYPSGSFWGLFITGIWQDVTLLGLPPVRTHEVFVQPEVSKDRLVADAELRNDTPAAQTVGVTWKIVPWKPSGDIELLTGPENRGSFETTPVLTGSQPQAVSIPAGGKTLLRIEQPVGKALEFWEPGAPNLYGLLVETTREGKVVDRKMTRFGWREFRFEGRKFLLNGKPIRLNIELCHFMGIPHLTPRWAWAWFRQLKELNMNAVRLHPMPHPRFFLDIADEQGMLIHAETAIYGSAAQLDYDAPEFLPRTFDHVGRMILRDRNHPSIFGWSVQNEVFAALNARLAPMSAEDKASYPLKVAGQMNQLMALAQKLDHTRQWVSGDGDGDLWPTDPTKLPVITVHYGDLARNLPASKIGPPWGITEATNTYFAMPPQYEPLVGEQAYESFEGRMRGVALDVYQNLTKFQIPLDPVVISIYDATWYGFKPLPFGVADSSRAPTPADGVLMPPYVEGKPGVQPERLGPYCMVMNPGFDPKLPLYDPWPHVLAMKAAYDPRGPQPFTVPPDPGATGKLPAPSRETVGFIGGPAGALAKFLAQAGAVLDFKPPSDLPDAGLWIVDSTEPIATPQAVKAALEQVAVKGGEVVFWGATEASLASVNTLLPKPIELTARTSTSLVRNRASAITAGLTAADLFFTENQSGQVIMDHGLAGPFVEAGKSLLQVPAIDWRRWFVGVSELIRPVAVVRNEREVQPSGVCLAALSLGRGSVLVTTLKPWPDNARMTAAAAKLLAGFGVKTHRESVSLAGAGLDPEGRLRASLVAGPFRAGSYGEALATDFLVGEATHIALAGGISSGQAWTMAKADARGFFVLPSTGNNETSYVAFSIRNPLSRELLQNPYGTQITLRVTADDGVKIWHNGTLLLEDAGPQSSDDANEDKVTVSLEFGVNRFLLKVPNASGATEVRIKLEARRPEVAKAISILSPEPKP